MICLTSSSSWISSLLSSTPYRQITITPARVTQNTINLAQSQMIICTFSISTFYPDYLSTRDPMSRALLSVKAPYAERRLLTECSTMATITTYLGLEVT